MDMVINDIVARRCSTVAGVHVVLRWAALPG
jgi:hypothetical protein